MNYEDVLKMLERNLMDHVEFVRYVMELHVEEKFQNGCKGTETHLWKMLEL